MSTWQVLFVGQNEQRNPFEVFVTNHGVEGTFRFFNSLSVVRVDGEDDAVALGVVLIPQRLQFCLATQIPKIQPEIFYNIPCKTYAKGDFRNLISFLHTHALV